jgi:hypothetical protein
VNEGFISCSQRSASTAITSGPAEDAIFDGSARTRLSARQRSASRSQASRKSGHARVKSPAALRFCAAA